MCGKKMGDEPDERTDIENWLLMEEEAASIQEEVISKMLSSKTKNIV